MPRKIENEMIGNVLFQISQKIPEERPDISIQLRSGRFFENFPVNWSASDFSQKDFVNLVLESPLEPIMVFWAKDKKARFIKPEFHIDELFVH